jgi:HAD superfamily hydrolase (TIGR01509 family)
VTVKAIFFDFGHTLFDVRDPGEFVSRVAAELGSSLDPTTALRLWDEIAECAGHPKELERQRDISSEAHRTNWVRLLSPLERFAPGLAEAVYQAHIGPENWAPYRDSGATLRELKDAGLSIAVISDCGFDLRPIFDHHFEGDALVDAFVLSFEHGVVKPAPELFQTALRTLDVAPSEALMVGDNPTTDGGASAVGIACLILPPARRGEARGLDRVIRLVQPATTA